MFQFLQLYIHYANLILLQAHISMSNLIIFGNLTKKCCEKNDDDCSLVFQFISFSCAIHALLCLCAYAYAKKQGIAGPMEPGQGGNYSSVPLPLFWLKKKHNLQQKPYFTKVSFFIQCTKMQLITLLNFNIKTCF